MFKEVSRIPICLEKGKKYQVEIQGNEVVISKEIVKPKRRDITNACTVEFRSSKHSDGNYVAILLAGVRSPVAIIGIRGVVVKEGYKVEKAYGASLSFRIFEENNTERRR